MQIRHSRADRHTRLNEHVPHIFEWKPIALALREEPAYDASGRNGTTLVKMHGLHIVLEVLREGAGLAKHRAPGPVVLQVLEGELRVEIEEEDEVIYLPTGEFLAIPAARPHAVEALRDSAFMLTIAPANERT